ncbi:MAG: hypothetical protein WBZ33_02225 [Thermoactinomyces sp.]|jgi:hypothetical protein
MARQTMLTLLFGGLLAIGASMLLRRNNRISKSFVRTIIRGIQKKPFLRRVVVEETLRRMFRRLRLAR